MDSSAPDHLACDVGLKALFRSIRRCAIAEYDEVAQEAEAQNAAGTHTALIEHLRKFSNESLQVIEEMAQLIAAFRAVSHVD